MKQREGIQGQRLTEPAETPLIPTNLPVTSRRKFIAMGLGAVLSAMGCATNPTKEECSDASFTRLFEMPYDEFMRRIEILSDLGQLLDAVGQKDPASIAYEGVSLLGAIADQVTTFDDLVSLAYNMGTHIKKMIAVADQCGDEQLVADLKDQQKTLNTVITILESTPWVIQKAFDLAL